MLNAQNRFVGIFKCDTLSARPTEWSAIVAGVSHPMVWVTTFDPNQTRHGNGSQVFLKPPVAFRVIHDY
jgi:hypothetical protein